jgi:transcriptional regulator with XRE-family HTH domain
VANDLLIQAIREKGLDLFEVADLADADPRTVQRWLRGRVPHPRYRQKLAAGLGVEEQELWPDALRVRRKAALSEIVAAAARRGDTDAPDWRALLRSASGRIDMLGSSLSQVFGARQSDKLLAGKAGAGCQLRIAIADPASDAIAAADARERPAGRLLARIRATEASLLPLAAHPGIEVHQHDGATSHTILRFDDTMLLTIHLSGVPGFQAPVLQLRREFDYGIFDQLAAHFETVWDASWPLGDRPAPGDQRTSPRAGKARPSAEERARAEKQKFLDSLDDVYRPPT